MCRQPSGYLAGYGVDIKIIDEVIGIGYNFNNNEQFNIKLSFEQPITQPYKKHRFHQSYLAVSNGRKRTHYQLALFSTEIMPQHQQYFTAGTCPYQRGHADYRLGGVEIERFC